MRADLAAFRRGLSANQRTQIPFAVAAAVTDMAQRAKVDVRASMSSTFKDPRAYTLGAVFATRASKSNPRALVGLKDSASGAGTPAWKYLGPEIEGGPRNRKRFEIRMGVPGYALPAPGAQLDAGGDISRSQLGKIIAALDQKAGSVVTARASRRGPAKPYKGARGVRPAYYLAKSRAGRPLAVSSVFGKGEVRPVLYFDQQAPTYTARWRLADVVLQSLQRSRVGAFERAWSQAIATARS